MTNPLTPAREGGDRWMLGSLIEGLGRGKARQSRASIPDQVRDRLGPSARDEFARRRAARLAGRPAPAPFAAHDGFAILSLLSGGLADGCRAAWPHAAGAAGRCLRGAA